MTALSVLERAAHGCIACPLYESRTKVVFGVGHPQASIMFIGEGPGRDEDLAGEPFVGRSGRLLDRLIGEELAMTRADCYIANVVKCRPPGNRDPLPIEVASSAHFLEGQLDVIAPRVVVTLGNFATRSVLHVTEGVTKLRGKTYEIDGRQIVPTFHPAAALRGGGVVLAQMRADFVRAKSVLSRRSNEVSIVFFQHSFTVRCQQASDTRALGAAIAAVLVAGDVVLLNGELGAGKTTLVKGVVGALDSDAEVTSPTFVLCHFYETDPTIAHVDCWRLSETREVEDLALLEFLDDGGVVLVEWGNIGRPVLGEDSLVVDFVIESSEGDGLGTLSPEGAVDTARRVRLSAEGERWSERLVALESRCRDFGLVPTAWEGAR